MKVIVKSASPSFWRAGLQFTREGVAVDTDMLTPEQTDAILHEPMLSVRPADADEGEPARPAKEPAAKKGKKDQ